jgi:hypothetical protein
MPPQLSKSHPPLTSKTASLRDCVTVAKFNSNDYEYVGHDEITKPPAVQYIGPRRLVYRSASVVLQATGKGNLTPGNRGQVKRRVHARTHARAPPPPASRPTPPSLPFPPLPPPFSPLAPHGIRAQNISPTAFSSDNKLFLPPFSPNRDSSGSRGARTR